MESKIGGAFKKVAGLAAAAFAAAGVGSFFKGTISLASDAEQSIGGVEAVFKGYSKTVIDQSAKADRALGLSGNSYRELATLIGAQLKNAGVPMDQLNTKTDGLIQMGADLAAMYGGTTADAVAALSSALKGEMDPIEKYGISLNDSALKAEAAALGLDVMGGSLTTAQKAQAVMSLVTKQGADAIGAFGRESDTAAGRQQRATAQWENLKTTIGDRLLPVWSGLMDFVGTKVLPGLEGAGKILTDKVGPAIQGVYDLVVKGDFTGNLRKAFNIEEDNPVVGFVLDARDALLHAWDNLTGLWDGLDISGLGTRIKDAAIAAGGDLLAGFKTGLDTGDWKPLGQTIVKIIGQALDTIGTLAGKLYDAFKTLVSKVDWFGIALEFGKQAPTLLVGLATGILNFDIGSLLKGLGDHWFEALMAIIGLALTPVRVVGKVGEILAKIPLVGKFLEWGLNAIKGLTDNVVGWIGDFVSSFVRGFIGEGTRIGGAFSSVFETVKVTLYTWGDDVIKWFKGLPDKFIQIAGDLGAGVRQKVDDMVALVGASLRNMWDDAVAKITGLKDSVVGIFQTMADWVVQRIWTPFRDTVANIAQNIWDWIVQRVTGMKDGIVSIFQTAKDWIIDRIWTPFRDTLVSIAQNIWDWIVQRITGLKDGVISIFQTAKDWVVDRIWTPFRDTLVSIAQNIWDWVAQRFTGLKDRAVAVFTEARDKVVGFFTDLRDKVSGLAQNVWDWVADKFTRMKDAVTGIFSGLVSSVKTIWDGIKRTAAEPINFVINTVLNGGLIKAFNKVIDTLHLPAGWRIGDLSPIQLATGGRVPGYSPHDKADNIPAMLTAGEYVQPVKTVDYYGHGLMNAIRNREIPREAFQHLAGGGPVYQQLFDRVKQQFPQARMNDGYRPGASDYHGQGLAVDLGKQGVAGGTGNSYMASMNQWLYDNFKSSILELIYDGSGDNRPDIKNGADHAYSAALQAQHRNHVHLASRGLGAGLGIAAGDGGGGGIGSLLGGIWDSVTGVLNSLKDSVTGPLSGLVGSFGDNPVTKIVGAVPGKLIDGMWETVKDKVTGLAGDLWNGAKDLASAGWDKVTGAAGAVWDFVSGGGDDVKGTVQSIAQSRGWGSGSQWSGLDYVISHESGWNPKAKNPSSTASGLGQFINSTWAAYRGSSGASRMMDASVADQGQAIMKYIAARYRDPVGAANFWKANHHYANGTSLAAPGLALVGERGPELVKFRGGETVLNNRQSRTVATETPLVGELHVHVGDGSTVKEGIEETMFQLRRIKRGGGPR